ncbi:hypothetical protein O4H26_00640 [Aequorivita viscosa]|nr:hypothetical protein [Aequorivita viscosa]
MKIYNWFILGILIFFGASQAVNAQDVNIVVPANNIFARAEYVTVQNVLYTNTTEWKKFWFWIINPTFKSTSANVFKNRSNTSLTLPTQFLQYRLARIGGTPPIFSNGDSWPGFMNFTTSDQAWYEPSFWGNHPRGNIDFSFKIEAAQFASQRLESGNYAMEITHNYDDGTFTPAMFNVVISIPKAISWLTGNNSNYTQISSLDNFRYAPAQIETNLGSFVVGNTVDFKLLGKSASSTIQFTSSKGGEGTRNVSIIKLGGDSPKITTLPLSASWKNFTPSNSFNIENGNRNSFQLQASISQADFRTHFFEAGTYKFQINLNAKSTDNSTGAQQNIDFTVNVLPLSEITIPTSGSSVNFNFNTIEQYQNGQTQTIANQLLISNNETYELNVKTDVPLFRKSGVQSDIPSSILQVGVEGGSQNVALSTTSQKIINNGTPVLDKSLNIKYTISALAAQSLVAKEKSTYSINVIYSFTAL